MAETTRQLYFLLSITLVIFNRLLAMEKMKAFKFWDTLAIRWGYLLFIINLVPELSTIVNPQQMPNVSFQGAKKVRFTACHSGKLYLACTSPKVISTSPKKIWWAGLITVLLLFKFLKKYHLPVGQVKNRIYYPNSKIH